MLEVRAEWGQRQVEEVRRVQGQEEGALASREDYDAAWAWKSCNQRRIFTYRAICAHDIFEVAGVFATLGVATRCTGAAGEATPLGALLPPHVAGVLEPHAA